MKKSKNPKREATQAIEIQFKTNEIGLTETHYTCSNGGDSILIICPESWSIQKVMARIENIYANRGKYAADFIEMLEERRSKQEREKEEQRIRKEMRIQAESLAKEIENIALEAGLNGYIDFLPFLNSESSKKLHELKSLLRGKGFTESDFGKLCDYNPSPF